MYVMTMNSGNGDELRSTFCGKFETHDEAHDAMVKTIMNKRAKWVEKYGCDEDCFETKVMDDEGYIIDGDMYDWMYYEQYFIFDCDDIGKCFAY